MGLENPDSRRRRRCPGDRRPGADPLWSPRRLHRRSVSRLRLLHRRRARSRARQGRRHPFARAGRSRARGAGQSTRTPQTTSPLCARPSAQTTPRRSSPPCAPATNAREISDPQDPVRAELRYLENRPAQLAYAYALAPDSPEGSSLIESRHKHVLPAPLKKSGGWREESHAHAMRQLRTLRANHLWNKYWSNN